MNEPSGFVYEDSGMKVGAPQPPQQPGTPFQVRLFTLFLTLFSFDMLKACCPVSLFK